MKFIKKLLVALAVMALCMMPMAGVLADENTTVNYGDENQTSTMDVAVKVDPTYTVAIPTKITTSQVTKTTGAGTQIGTFSISATNCFLPIGGKLKVTAGGSGKQNDFVMQNPNKTAAVRYDIFVGDASTALIPDGEILSVNAATPNDTTENCSIKLAEAPPYAGEYGDTITFNIAVDDQ